MKQRINPLWVRRFIVLAILAAVAKALMLVLATQLPYGGVEPTVATGDSLSYSRYAPSRLFGIEAHKAAPKSSGKQTEVYRLDALTLRGIYLEAHNAFILVEEGVKTELFSIGDRYKRYTLVDILPAKAIFEKDGQRYALAFKEENMGPVATAAVPSSSVVTQNGFTSIKRKEVRYYSEHFDAIWQNIKIQEVYRNKKLTGFEVKWIKKDSIFAKMGLQEHDIITGINGKPLTSVAEVLKLYKNMDQIDNLTLDIQRNNTERQLDYAIYD
ncbi:PDZ domain-containing protein [Sulfurimonas sp. HSL-3221]|uniref:PDZ domain-containing protein n=1 Tax=Sulfurimonadaceae TaxID=2771471 RepID=UPI001E4E7AD5|nr:PDZ domain-containing protein [Sulfurimonas sp. HSL-3221]UFS62155.1 PDZ domain-containing protein [Sulfurimonas sp. HSL-3221]